jgi:creatinine deaminase
MYVFSTPSGRHFGFRIPPGYYASATYRIMSDDTFLGIAIEEARAGAAEGGIPIGAVLVVNGAVAGRGHNQRVQKGNPILHGETAALENAGRLTAKMYQQATMYTTLSPCAMCTGAILLYKIPRVVVGENTTFMGEEELLRQRGVDVVVKNSSECMALMTDFIAKQPTLWNEDIGE